MEERIPMPFCVVKAKFASTRCNLLFKSKNNLIEHMTQANHLMKKK